MGSGMGWSAARAAGLAGLLFAAAAQAAPPTGYTRAEQDAPTVSYSGGTWYSNQSDSDSGGSAVLSMDTGARADFLFTGSTVQWVGYSDAWSGIADVYVDGIYQTSVDTYAATSLAQAS